MADEGEFPKIDGDVLYASEVNRINPKIIGSVWQNVYDTQNTGSDYGVVGGSILYAGSPVISEYVFTDYIMTKQGDAVVMNTRLRYSGASFEIVTGSLSTTANAWMHPIRMAHFLTSGAITTAGGDVTLPFAIFVEKRSSSVTNATLTNVTAVGY